jgi:hypothetical protein
MESVFFVISYAAGFFNTILKKIGIVFSRLSYPLVSFLCRRSKTKDVDDVQALTEEEYNRRFAKFFPKENEAPDNSFEKKVDFRKPFDGDRFYVKWSDSWM